MRIEFDSGLFAIADDISVDHGDPATALDLDTRELHRRVQNELAVQRAKTRHRGRTAKTRPVTPPSRNSRVRSGLVSG